MIIPKVKALPEPPVRSDAPADFSAKADGLVAALPGFVVETNEVAQFVGARADEVEASRSAVATDLQSTQQALADGINTISTLADAASSSASSANEGALIATSRANEVVLNANQVSTDSQQVATDAQMVAQALADAAGGPVISINGKTGFVDLSPSSIFGEQSISINEVTNYKISNYDSFYEYIVQVSAGSVSIFEDTITLVAPGTPQTLTLTVISNGDQRDIAIDVSPYGPAAPVVNKLSDIVYFDFLDLSISPFSMVGLGSDIHSATDWEIWTGPRRSGEMIWSSLDNSASKLAISVPAGILTASSVYYLSVRYIGTATGAGKWAESVFRTASQLLTGAAGQPYGGGYFYGVMRYPDGDYAMITASKASEASLAWKTASSATTGTASPLDGLANSNAMNNSAHPAAKHCRDYRGGGFDDWYLPAKDEQELRYRSLKPDSKANNTGSGVNGNSVPAGSAYASGAPTQTTAESFKVGGPEVFDVSAFYWTSTENSATNAWVQRFSDGSQTTTSKNYAYLVRPVRRLKI